MIKLRLYKLVNVSCLSRNSVSNTRHAHTHTESMPVTLFNCSLTVADTVYIQSSQLAYFVFKGIQEKRDSGFIC